MAGSLVGKPLFFVPFQWDAEKGITVKDAGLLYVMMRRLTKDGKTVGELYGALQRVLDSYTGEIGDAEVRSSFMDKLWVEVFPDSRRSPMAFLGAANAYVPKESFIASCSGTEENRVVWRRWRLDLARWCAGLIQRYYNLRDHRSSGFMATTWGLLPWGSRRSGTNRPLRIPVLLIPPRSSDCSSGSSGSFRF